MYTFGSSGSRQLGDGSNEPRKILMKSGEPEWILCAREGFKAFKSYHLISRVYYSIIAGTRVHYGSIIMLNYTGLIRQHSIIARVCSLKEWLLNCVDNKLEL